MGDISLNFNRKEFECNCGCKQDTVDFQLISTLEILREVFEGKAIHINSGNRCVEYNKKIGGTPRSQHLLSKAADIVVEGVNPKEVYDVLDKMCPTSLGLGGYEMFTHVDVRNGKGRW